MGTLLSAVSQEISALARRGIQPPSASPRRIQPSGELRSISNSRGANSELSGRKPSRATRPISGAHCPRESRGRPLTLRSRDGSAGPAPGHRPAGAPRHRAAAEGRRARQGGRRRRPRVGAAQMARRDGPLGVPGRSARPPPESLPVPRATPGRPASAEGCGQRARRADGRRPGAEADSRAPGRRPRGNRFPPGRCALSSGNHWDGILTSRSEVCQSAQLRGTWYSLRVAPAPASPGPAPHPANPPLALPGPGTVPPRFLSVRLFVLDVSCKRIHTVCVLCAWLFNVYFY